jgi:hypothetical protein
MEDFITILDLVEKKFGTSPSEEYIRRFMIVFSKIIPNKIDSTNIDNIVIAIKETLEKRHLFDIPREEMIIGTEY